MSVLPQSALLGLATFVISIAGAEALFAAQQAPTQDPRQDPAEEDESNQKPPLQDPSTGGLPDLPISLDAALTLAETNNLGLHIQDLETEIAQFNALGSWGSYDFILGASGSWGQSSQVQVFPGPGGELTRFQVNQEDINWNLNLSRALETGGNVSLNLNSRRFTLTGVDSNQTEVNDVMTLAFVQPLLRGAGYDRATSEMQEAELRYLQQVEFRRGALQQLLLDTSDAYWTLVQTRNQLDVVESSLALGREQLERNKRLLAAGVGTEVEVIQAEAEVARREEVRLSADVAQRIAGDALKALLFPTKDYKSWNTLLLPTTETPSDVSVDDVISWEDALEVALDNRPELRQQAYEVEIAELIRDRAASDRRVGLDLELNYGSLARDTGEGDAFEEIFDLESDFYSATLRLDAPIQNRTRAYAARAAASSERAAKVAMDQLQVQIVSEVRDAVRQLHYQSLAVRAATESLRAATRQLAAEEARYENDLSTNFQVLEFQTQLVEAMNSEQTARTNFAKAQFQLRAAQGILGERP